MTTPRRPVIAAAGTMFMLFAATAHAQPFDHLKCFKVKDPGAFKSATMDLTDTLFGADSGCRIKKKAKEFCVPVEKSVTAIEDGNDNPFPGQAQQFDRLCYKLKCPEKKPPGTFNFTDQFDTRDFEKFKVFHLCTPAVKGAAPSPIVWPEDAQEYTAETASYFNSLTIPEVVDGQPTCCKDFGPISRDYIESGTDEIDNALASLAESLGGFADFQQLLDDSLQDGSLVVLLDHRELDFLNLPDDFVLVQLLGGFGPGTDYTLADQGLGTFEIEPGSFVPGTGEPLNFHVGSQMGASAMFAGPFPLSLAFPFGFLSLELTAEGAEVAADHGVITPAGVPYTNGTLSGFILLDGIFGTINEILGSPVCACLGLTEDVYEKQPNGSYSGSCVSGADALCPGPDEEICAVLAGDNLFADPNQVCTILPGTLESVTDLNIEGDTSVYEGLSVGLEWTAVNAQILGVATTTTTTTTTSLP